MTWLCVALLSSAACSESAATAPDATAVVLPAAVVISLDQRVLAVGSRSHARVTVVNRSGGELHGPNVRWQVISGTEFVGIDRDGMLVARATGRALISATVDSVTGTFPVDVVPLFTDGDANAGWAGQRSKQASPALPAVFLDFPYPSVTGRSIKVDAGDNLQSALKRARRGDEVVLAAGATFTGNFTLPALGGTPADGWVTIRGEASDRLPPLGTRVSPADGRLMPRVVTPNTEAAIRLEPAASGWRMVGLEVTVLPAVTQQQYGLLWLGDGGRSQNALASVPSDIVLDRMYIHGQPTTNMSRCVALNSARTQISDSYLAECHGKGFDSQAILGWNGPGPYKIVNNHLEGAGENIMFGGADPSIPNLVPSDIEIRRNYVYTPVAWKGVWTKKNLLELKNASRVLIEGNVFEGSWVDGQVGWAIMLRSANQDGGCRWCRTTDVTFRRNYVTHAAGAFNVIGGVAGSPVDTTARRILVTESVFDSIGVAPYTGVQRGFMLNEAPVDVTFDQTVLTGSMNILMYLDRDNPAQGANFRNSVWKLNPIMVDGVPQATQALALGSPGYTWSGIGLLGSATSSYPTGTTFLSSESQSSTAARVRASVRAATAGVAVP